MNEFIFVPRDWQANPNASRIMGVKIEAPNTMDAMKQAEALDHGLGKLYIEVTPSTHHDKMKT